MRREKHEWRPGGGAIPIAKTTTNASEYIPPIRAEQLDVTPTPAQRALLRHLAAGYELALDPAGRPIILQTGETVPRGTVDALLRRRWLGRPPGFPLLDPPARLTDRGRRALNRR